MKSKIHSLSERFKPVILYRDDIEAILAILHEVSETVEMSSDEHIFNTDEEWLDVKTDYFTHLEIASSHPYIKVELETWKTDLYSSDDSPATRGAYEKIKDILLARKRRIRSRPDSWIWVFPVFLCSFSIGVIFKPFWNYTILGIFIVLYSALQVWALRIEMRKHSIIIPKYRSEAPGFWQRNSDSIIIAIAAAIIGAVIGSIVTVLAK